MDATTDPRKVCKYCIHFGEWRGKDVWCVARKLVRENGSGCWRFVREVGSDDDLDSTGTKPGENHGTDGGLNERTHSRDA